MNNIKNIPMLGYVSVYLNLKFDDGTSVFCSSKMDFKKDINQSFFNEFANVAILFYKDKFNKTTISAKYVTEEEYNKAYVADDSPSMIIKWDEKENK